MTNLDDEKTCISEKNVGHEKKDIVFVWKKVGNKMIPFEECNENIEVLYHDTKFERLKSIVSTGLLLPDPGESNAVSFSLNFFYTYTASNIKMVFWRDAVKSLVKPMRYHSNWMFVPDERCTGERIYEDREFSEDERIINKELRIHDLTVKSNKARAEARMNPQNYIYECEWLSYEPVPVNDKTVKSIMLVIPLVISRGWHGGNSACGQNDSIRMDSDATIVDLIEKVRDVKEVCKKRGLAFGGIYTDYRTIVVDESKGTYVDLTDENIRLIENEEMPVLSYASKRIHAWDFPCVEKDEMKKRRDR